MVRAAARSRCRDPVNLSSAAGVGPDHQTTALRAMDREGDGTMTLKQADNGVNSQALLDARTALSEAPEAAEFTWRSTCSWLHGTYSKSTVTTFSGLGQEQAHQATFTFEADHPACFASEDRGATPV